jgi:glycosyltransferase involved in cell wall biosynthesis
MKILQVHNQYLRPGGEDVAVEAERALLVRHGHEVTQFFTRNTKLRTDTVWSRITTAANSIWSRDWYACLREYLSGVTPDVAHVHNTFADFSPSVIWALASAGVPIVQTYHNYRFTCANALLLRASQPCTDCVGKRIPYAALRHRCYRDSLTQTATLASTQMIHRLIGTQREVIDSHIALTPFMAQLLADAGFPSDRIFVKPNFVADPPSSGNIPLAKRPIRVVAVSRLTPEKGIDLLISAWRNLAPPGWELIVAGDGPESSTLRRAARNIPSITWTGWLEQDAVHDLIATARLLVVPSRWYEGLPITLIEAFSAGVPVVAPAHGPFPDHVQPGRTGFLFRAGDSDDLSRALAQAVGLSESEMQRMSDLARMRYFDEFTPETNYRLLMKVYAAAIRRSQRRKSKQSLNKP